VTSATLPDELSTHNLRRRALQVAGLLVVLALIAWFAPGLGEVREKLRGVDPAWLGVGVLLEIASSASYVLMFRPIFCRSMPWKLSQEISWSEVGVGSIVPASGIGGLALGAWVLGQAGMPAETIARRSVAFFLIKSSINFVLVAVLGFAMALGLGPDLSLWLTLLPAVLATLLIAAVLLVPRLGPGPDPSTVEGKLRVGFAHARGALVTGVGEAVAVVRSGTWMAIAGSIGYYAFDNAVLWATFRAFDQTIPVTVLLMGYLIGQLGGLLPLPGGIGGIDGGLIGTLVVYGAPAAATATAVLAYRVILVWVPLIGGGIAFSMLRRDLGKLDSKEVCTRAATVTKPPTARSRAAEPARSR
jgi:uncharacterized membrane protein YbhN (UPF0104 family)